MINVSPSATLPELARLVQLLANKVRELDERTKPNVEGWAGNQSNVTVSRTFDANTVTTAELADVVGTLINDEINIGIIK